MFGFGRSKLPIAEKERLWVDRSFERLAMLLGSDRMIEGEVIQPTPEYFPDRYDGSDASVEAMLIRVATRMGVDPGGIVLELFDDDHGVTASLVPFGESKSSGAGGLYIEDPEERTVIAVNRSYMADPMSLVAVLAHEVGHVILLGSRLVDREEPDMEPLNDLLTVFLGFGIFNANAAFQFRQYNSYDRQGWSTNRLGYLPEQVFGYALARFASERGEFCASWARHLSTNVGSYFRQSMAWLRKEGSRLDFARSFPGTWKPVSQGEET